MRLAIFIGLTLLTGSAAYANCQPGSAARSLAAVEAIRAGTATAAEQAGKFVDWAKDCPSDPFNLYQGALVWRELAIQRDKVGKLSEAYQAIATAWQLIESEQSLPHAVKAAAKVGEGFSTRPFDGLQALNLRAVILEGLLNVDARTGKTHPFLAEQAGPCQAIVGNDAQTASRWIRQTGVVSPAALRLIDRSVANCGSSKSQGDRSGLATRAKLRLSQAETAKTPEEVLKWVELARADAKAYLGSGSYRILYWDESDDAKLTRLEIKTRFAIGPSAFIPRAAWFDAANLASGATKMAIAAELDRLWGEVPKEGDGKMRGELMKPYSRFISSLAKEADDAGLGQSVKLVIYEAAKGHAEGLYRSPAHADKPKPFEITYSWLKPKP